VVAVSLKKKRDNNRVTGLGTVGIYGYSLAIVVLVIIGIPFLFLRQGLQKLKDI
jgi:hypothetical protein